MINQQDICFAPDFIDLKATLFFTIRYMISNVSG